MWQGVEQLRAEYSLEILQEEWHDRMGKERLVCEKYQGANLRFGFKKSVESKES